MGGGRILWVENRRFTHAYKTVVAMTTTHGGAATRHIHSTASPIWIYQVTACGSLIAHTLVVTQLVIRRLAYTRPKNPLMFSQDQDIQLHREQVQFGPLMHTLNTARSALVSAGNFSPWGILFKISHASLISFIPSKDCTFHLTWVKVLKILRPKNKLWMNSCK